MATGKSRLFLAVGSQILASGTNFAMTILVVRTSTPYEIGTFAVLYSIALLTSEAVRSMIYEAAIVGGRVNSESTQDRLFVGLATGTIVGIGVALAGAFLGSNTQSMALVFSAALPAFALAELSRLFQLGGKQEGKAVRQDAIWAFVQFSLLAAVAVTGARLTATLVVGAWAAGAAIAATYGAIVLGGVSRRGAWKECKSTSRISVSLGLDFLLRRASSQAAVFGIVIAGSLAVAGVIRSTEILFAPLTLQAAFINSYLLAQRHAALGGDETARRLADAATGLVVLLSVLWVVGIITNWLPAQLLVGASTWEGTQSVVLPVGLASLFGLVGAIFAVELRSRPTRLTSLVRARSITAPVVPLAVIVGATKGLAATGWALAVSQGLVMVVFGSTYWRSNAASEAPASARDGTIQRRTGALNNDRKDCGMRRPCES